MRSILPLTLLAASAALSTTSALSPVETIVDLVSLGANLAESLQHDTQSQSVQVTEWDGVVRAKGEVHAMDGWSWVDCGTPTDAVQITSLLVSPDPPVPGKNLTVTATGDVQDPIEEGAYADVLVKLGLIKLLQKRFDVCEEAANANMTLQCPVSEGTYTIEQTVELPVEIPKAKFLVQVRGFTDIDADMVCLDIMVDFTKRGQ